MTWRSKHPLRTDWNGGYRCLFDGLESAFVSAEGRPEAEALFQFEACHRPYRPGGENLPPFFDHRGRILKWISGARFWFGLSATGRRRLAHHLAGGELISRSGAIPSGHPENGACPPRVGGMAK